jgi:hypothetical protein
MKESVVSVIKRIELWLVIALLALSGCQAQPAAPAAPEAAPELGEIKQYLLDRSQALHDATAALKTHSDRYYALAEANAFNYEQLWTTQRAPVIDTLQQARAAWMAASPLYEQMEGIVAGTPRLAEYDVILDAGGAAGAENAVPFDLTLPDGRVLPKPGNLFGVTESALWGTEPAYVIAGVAADLDGDGVVSLGEALPDASVLKAAVDALDSYAAALKTSAEAWQPSLTDAFTALVVMTPTMGEYFASWRDSRFVSGAASTQRDFVAISRLADILDILSGLQVVYTQVQPLARAVDAEQAAAVAGNLAALRSFVAEIHQQEQAGRRFTPEEADIYGAEAQNRATAITGQISQLAAQLAVEVAN